MPRVKASGLLLVAVLGLVAAWGIQQRTEESIPPGIVHAREVRRRTDKILSQDRVAPRSARPDWEKAQADADRLLVLAKQIHGQLLGGPEHIPADLPRQLKEVEKLSRRLRRELRL